MIERNGNKLIFLLCVPRSGSSLATVMLQNHTRIYAAQEMWFLMSLYDLKKPEKRAYGGTAILNQFFDGVLPESVYDEACRSFGANVYNGLLSTSEADMVVDKSPRYYYILEFLDRLFPQSKRIGLFRNPLDVAASYKKVNQRSAPNFNLADQLNDPSLNMKMVDITVGLFRYQQYFAQKNENAFWLKYEQMAAHPEEQMQDVCRFLDISYEEGIEKYGDYMDSAKSELFYSMGVGDPYLSEHRTPHMKSIGNWRTMLDHREIEAYCRILGANLFRELGYEAELEEAQRLTGVVFEEEPDMKWIEAKTKQFTEATGCRWEPEYKMHSAVLPETSPEVANALSQESKDKAEADELLRMRMTLRSLEKRMEQHYAERDRLHQESERLRKEVRDMKQKMNRIKSLIPFNRSLGRVFNAYLVRKGVEK